MKKKTNNKIYKMVDRNVAVDASLKNQRIRVIAYAYTIELIARNEMTEEHNKNQQQRNKNLCELFVIINRLIYMHKSYDFIKILSVVKFLTNVHFHANRSQLARVCVCECASEWQC